MNIDVKNFWDIIGSAWSNFQNKSIIETFWWALASGIDIGGNQTVEAQKSRAMLYMSPTIDMGPVDYYIVYSGLAVDMNVTPMASGGSFSYQIDEYIYSIPELLVDYKYQGTTYYNTYTQGVDYIISGLNHIIWIGNIPTTDIRFPGKGVLLASARHVYSLNPMLMGIWARLCQFKYDYFVNYNTYGNDSYKHLKMLIWALVIKQMRGPSIKNLQDGMSIARGLPFAYTSGIMNYTGTGPYTLTVGADTYILPSGLVPISPSAVQQFDPLAAGCDLWDYTTNAGIVNSLANVYNRRSTIIYETSNAVKALSYSPEFFNLYMSGIMPSQIQYFII